jgi:ribose 1,5-bisphosphokinase
MTRTTDWIGPGALVLVVGPSGSGKDALLHYARSRLTDPRIVFCRRIVTRAASAHEDHDTMTEDAFAAEAAAGAFALHWRAHGLSYALPIETDRQIAEGCAVVANASRAIVPIARLRYRNLRVVWLHVPIEVARSRLLGRGRETSDEILERLGRAEAIAPFGGDVVVLDNSGPVEVAGEALVGLLQRAVAAPAHASP